MAPLFLEFAVRAALLVGGTAIVLFAMRVKSAAAKHSVWAGVVILMLILPIWSAWGPKASLRVLPPLARSTANEVVVRSETRSSGMLPSRWISMGLAFLLGGYVLGMGLLLLRLAIGTARAGRMVRGAILHDRILTSSLCAAPVTVGFFHPTIIFPEHWRQWSPAQLGAVFTHEREHARRRDPLVQWLALLNRALFWFHPASWWLERHLSALAEEACDSVVLERGHNPREYSEYLIDLARSVMSSGARLNIAGMAMPGSSLPRRIRRILDGGSVPHTSCTRRVCVGIACAITCTAFTAGTLDHARPDYSPEYRIVQGAPASVPPIATKFVLGDLKIEGDVHDRDGVKDRILKAWKDREYNNAKDLADAVMEVAIRGDFQNRGYFKVVAQDPTLHSLRPLDGKQRILIIATITQGDQYRLGVLTIQSVPLDHALRIPAATLREQFHLRDGDLFNVSEVRAGLERVKGSYDAQDYGEVKEEPDITVDDVNHLINVRLRITEGLRTK